MMELVQLYQWTLLAGCLFSGALALLGCQLAARDRAMQTVCVSQGAMLGVLVALGTLESVVHSDPDSHLTPFLFSFALSALTFLGTDHLAKRKALSKSTLFAATFAVLLAAGYFVSALFPALESHMAQIYFGDLATLTEFDAKMTLLLGSVSLVILTAFRRRITGQSFELATFGYQYSAASGRKWSLLFNLLTLVLLCFSVQFLGFLFTVALLFLPTTVLNLGRSQGLARHLTLACVAAMGGALLGFLLSLRFARFPTVPTITLVVFVLCGLISVLDQLHLHSRQRHG